MVLIFFNLATTATANGTALSMYTSVGLKADEEPHPWYKTFWCVLFLVIPVGVLVLEHNIEGLNVLKTIQSMITISSLPVLIALATLFISFAKTIKEDIKSGEILDYIDQNKHSKWSINK
jgi:BCCT family betaine/carnitine transporter